MIDKTLLGYAILNYYSKDGKSILDAYVPLIVSCIVDSQYEKVDRDDIKRMLNDKYGLGTITLGAIDSIMQIMVSKNILNKDHGTYWVDRDKLLKNSKIDGQESLLSRFEGIIIKIQTYAKDKFNLSFTTDEIEKCFLLFLQNHDMEIAISDESVYSVLSKRKPDKTCRYILSRFLLDSKEQSPEIIADITAFAQGHSLASVVSLDNFENYGGKIDKVKIALDAPIIFNMLGLNGPSNKALTDELIEILKEQKASFIIFRQNYEEVLNTLTDAEWRLRSHKFEYDKSSRVLKYACREHKTADYIQMKIQQVDQLLDDHKIVIADAPNFPAKYEEIDVAFLTELIKNRYSHNGEKELKEYQEDLINTDVDTISYIFRLRGNTPAINLKRCNALLLSTNKAIAYASRHQKVSKIRHAIPACMTDVFLSTLLWANFPKKNSGINEKLLMSECYSNVLLDDDILKAFYEDVKKKSEENRITNEQVALLLTSNLTVSLLEQKTYNDFERYSDATPEEIVREIEAEQKKENAALSDRLGRHEKNYRKIANVSASVIYYLVIGLLAFAFIWIKFIDPSKLLGIKSIAAYVIIVFSALWGILTNAGVIKNKKNVITWLSDCFFIKISKFFEED